MLDKSCIGNYLEELLGQLLSHALPAFNQWDADAIHDARVATRRLGAALKLLKPVMGGHVHKRLKGVLKKVRRRLGPLRDMDVMLGHFAEQDHAAFPRALDWITDQIELERQDRRRQARRRQRLLRDLADWAGWQYSPTDLDTAARRILVDELPQRLETFATRARALAASREQPASEALAPDPHALRIAGKELRYTLELARVAGISVPDLVLKTFKQMQDALGLWHDHVVISESVFRAAIEAGVAAHDSALFGQLLELGRANWLTAEDHIEMFLLEWSESGPDLCRQINELLEDARNQLTIPHAPELSPAEAAALATSPVKDDALAGQS